MPAEEFVRRTDEEKIALVRQMEDAKKAGITVEEAARVSGIAVSQYYNWRKEFADQLEAAAAAPAQPETAVLGPVPAASLPPAGAGDEAGAPGAVEKRVYRTEEEKRAYVQQVDDLLKQGLTVQNACASIGINGSQYYSWQRQLKTEEIQSGAVASVYTINFLPQSEDAPRDKEMETMKLIIAELLMENVALKKMLKVR